MESKKTAENPYSPRIMTDNAFTALITTIYNDECKEKDIAYMIGFKAGRAFEKDLE